MTTQTDDIVPSARGPLAAACDREPIHIPGSIQPHGLLLIADGGTLRITAVAGDVEGRLAVDWLNQPLSRLLGQSVETIVQELPPGVGRRFAGVRGSREIFDAVLRRTSQGIAVELEPAPAERLAAADMLAELDTAAMLFETAPDLPSLCDEAARAFGTLTGFDRVLIYHFLADGSGVVLGESRGGALGSFLDHHFPASDIPAQARALYLRNRVRVIPDVNYVPAPLRPPAPDAPFDMSDISIRSVSPIHLQYMRNMGVGASASISIVVNDRLWGLVTCHNHEPRPLAYEWRLAAQTLASGLARQLRTRHEQAEPRERSAQRAVLDLLERDLGGDMPIADILHQQSELLRYTFDADGFAVVTPTDVRATGEVPDAQTLRELAAWVAQAGGDGIVCSHELPLLYPPAAGAAQASGLLATTIGGNVPLTLLWLRVESPEIVKWAGNPHKAMQTGPNEMPMPRTSFEAWSETVLGRSRPWSAVAREGVARLVETLVEAQRNRCMRELNRQLTATVAENERLLQHKDYLIREVNHRVQNSLQLVSAFLRLQSRGSGAADIHADLEEAQRRVAAVALVHRQLYSSQSLEEVNLASYLAELTRELASSMGGESWGDHLTLALEPVTLNPDRAVKLGLIVTELVLNTAKYAYGGTPGPLRLELAGDGDTVSLTVADQGSGKLGTREGFGSRMLGAMVRDLQGAMNESSNEPGLVTRITLPTRPTAL